MLYKKKLYLCRRMNPAEVQLFACIFSVVLPFSHRGSGGYAACGSMRDFTSGDRCR